MAETNTLAMGLRDFDKKRSSVASLLVEDPLNCIDAIEGTVKSIISRMFQTAVEDHLDDSEYVQNVRTVIEGAEVFVKQNSQITETPELLRNVLYEFSKQLWLSQVTKACGREEETETNPGRNTEDLEYFEYYYDYLYHHKVYPL